MNATSRRRAWCIAPLALFVFFAFGAASCGSSSSSSGDSGDAATADPRVAPGDVLVPPSGEPQAGGKLTYGLDADTDGWDPTANRWSTAGLTVAQAIFDPIAAWDADFHTQPYLAQSIEHNDTYDQWTITMRPGTTFHDGTPVDAAAVKKFLDAGKASVLTGSTFGPVTDVSVDGPLSVKVSMSIPWTAYPAALTTQVGMLAAPSQLDNKATGSRQPVGTGPFVFDSWTASVLSAKKNTSYWRPGLPYLDAVDFRPITEPQTLYDALRTGDVNMYATDKSPIKVKVEEDARNGDVQLVKSRGEVEESSVMLNTTAAPVDDVRLRTALAYATDTANIAQVNQADPADIARGPFVDGTHWAIETDYPTFDMAKAQQLIADLEAEKGPISFVLNCTDGNGVVEVCQALQASWKTAGVDVTLDVMDQPTLINNALAGEYQATIWRQFTSPDPDGDTLWWNGANTGADGGLALNMARNSDPVLDAAIYVGRTSHDDTERKLAYITVQTQLALDVPYLWLSHVTWDLVADNSMRGLTGATLPDGAPAANLIAGIMRLTEISFQK